MATHTESGPQAVSDVTGLPEPVIQSIRQLVDAIRGQSLPPAAAGPRRSLGGCLAGRGLTVPTQEDIEEVRREMWANFPRDLPND